MNSIIRRIITLIIGLFIAHNTLFAQSVGVVLSGGGAKGLYHVGILKALEENDIPIDYVSGTSMGAIVAAMYASGITIAEMEELFYSDQVTKWLSGKIEERYQRYYKKESNSGSMVSLDVDINKFLSREDVDINSGGGQMIDEGENKGYNITNLENYYINTIVPSVQLDLAMLDMFTGANTVAKQNFDSLFVPFRCLSVDILTRKAFVWDKGELSKAVRSSMAIPFLFKPMIVDSMLMYDGGILNNFPWSETLDAFDADVLIGGICTSGSVDPSSIMGQVSLLTMANTDYGLPDSLGVKIQRDVNVGLMDYTKAREVIEIGYADAMLAMPEIKERISRRVTDQERALKRRKFIEKIPSLAIGEVEVTGLNERQTEYVERLLHFENGELMSFDEFKSEYFKIIEGGMIAADFPTATYIEEKGYYKINMSMTARHSFKAMAGANISSGNINAGYMGLNYSSIGTNSSSYTLSGYLGNFYSTADATARNNFYSGAVPFYIKTTLNYTFLDFGRGNSQRTSFNNRTNEYSRLSGVYLSSAIGIPTSRRSKFEARLSVGSDLYKYDYNDTEFALANYNKNYFKYINLNATISRNSLNFRTFATEGVKQSISAFAVNSSDYYIPGFDTGSGGYIVNNIKHKNLWYGASYLREDYNRLGKHFSLGYSVHAIYTDSPTLSNNYITKLIAPGFYPTSPSKTLFIPEYHDSSFAAVGVMPIIEWNNSLYMTNGFYAYYGNLRDFHAPKENFRYVVSTSFVYQSAIGPISLNHSYYTIKTSNMASNYWMLNIGFLIFKDRGIKYF